MRAESSSELNGDGGNNDDGSNPEEIEAYEVVNGKSMSAAAATSNRKQLQELQQALTSPSGLSSISESGGGPRPGESDFAMRARRQVCCARALFSLTLSVSLSLTDSHTHLCVD